MHLRHPAIAYRIVSQHCVGDVAALSSGCPAEESSFKNKTHFKLGRFADAIKAGRISKVEKIDDCCVLAAVGHQMASRKGVAATMFSALAKANINIRCAFALMGFKKS